MNDPKLPPAGVDAARPPVLVIGDLMLDRVLEGAATRLSAEAPVPIVRQHREEARPGGAANVAANLAALGCRVRLAGAVGADRAAEELAACVAGAGVEQYRPVTCAGRSTTVKMRVVAQRQQVVRIDREEDRPLGASGTAGILAALDGLAGGCRAILVADYGKGVVTPAVWSALVRIAGAAGIPLLVDPAPGAAWSLYSGAKLIKPNWREALLAAGLHQRHPADPQEVGRRLLSSCEVDWLVITRGERGLLLFRRDGTWADLPARRREVYDVTGAGDTVLAALGWSLALGLDLGEAASLANLAGGLVVERFGTACVTRGDLERALVPEAALADKIVDLEVLLARLAAHRQAGRRIVFTNGCFDLLHVGHLRLLRHAAACGEVLVVGLNSDASVRRLKGPGRPIVGEWDRALLLAGFSEVDAVVVFADDTPAGLVARVQPDVLVKGGDYQPGEVVGREVVEERGGRVELVPLRDGLSTSEIERRIRAAGAGARGEA